MSTPICRDVIKKIHSAGKNLTGKWTNTGLNGHYYYPAVSKQRIHFELFFLVMGMAFLMIPFIISDLIFFASKCGHLSATVFQCTAFFLVCVMPSYPTIPPRFISRILSFLTYSWTSQSGLIVSHVWVPQSSAHSQNFNMPLHTCQFPVWVYVYSPSNSQQEISGLLESEGFFRKRTVSMSFAFPQSLIKCLVFMWPMQSRQSTWVKLD